MNDLMNTLDQKLNQTFEGKVVRKDLLHRIKKGTNVPTFVLEFLLAKYCASDDDAEINAGMEAVLATLQDNYVRPDEANAAQSKVATKGRYRFIDKVHVRYVEKEKRHWAALENFNSQRIAISQKFYRDNDRLLEGGIWADLMVAHNDIEEDNYAFYLEDLRPIQLSRFDFDRYAEDSQNFSRDEWLEIILRTVGLEPTKLNDRQKLHYIARLAPLVEPNFNFIDMSIEQIVNSSQYDLFQPLPAEFDLAVMDRFACYLPGWEMPKNSSEFLTNNYGFITDYLAEAFHHLFQHTNRYEEVSRRIRLGAAIEGRDEKGINKMVAAFLKILHPAGSPTDQQFEQYVAYAVECRRRVKEQMNKRKPDDEFARINLSYMNANGQEIIVFCPESQEAIATQNPRRRTLEDERMPSRSRSSSREPKEHSVASRSAAPLEPLEQQQPLQEQHFTIYYGATGYSYDSIMSPYFQGAKAIVIEEPYIRMMHQIQNFVRFCETVIKAGTIKRIELTTSYDNETPLAELQEKLNDLQQSLLELDVVLDIQLNPNLHDREIRVDNGWVIKIGRGLDFYQKPGSWFEVGANDLSLRKCLETKIDIYRVQ
jgi:Putative ATP-dependent Lon protease/Phospholipase D-like domain at C-terminus of MIT